ncbi:hypothetical protein BZG36_05376 [Bifiguratus adelaidae]|uniref:Uncharacterized protein n=1 Tax=Bifiguratus adelaidae TaxID=1938954 RepID=A0A261XUY9_9FUNG|nr:hypothetical protein BZG36_05376 [Bifiguratus adelaidae]
MAISSVLAFAREHDITEAFWYETYIGFCAVTVIYVLAMYGEVDDESLQLASECQRIIGEKAMTSSIARRYAIVLEVLRGRLHQHTQQESAVAQDVDFLFSNGWDALEALIMAQPAPL